MAVSKIAESRKPGRKPGTAKTGGRQAGTPNKLTTQAKDAIAAAAEGLGGVPRLIAWARENAKNEAAFWTSIYTRLVPVDVNGSHNVSIVDKTQLRDEAREVVRGLFGAGGTGESPRADGGGVLH